MRKVSYFMDYTKVQTDLMKAAIKNDRLPDYNYEELEVNGRESIALVKDGDTVIIVPKMLYYLNNESVFKNKTPISCVNKYIETAADAVPLALTNEMELVPGTKNTLQIFRNGDEKIYINSKKLDIFKTAAEINFKGTDYKSPVFVYSYTDIIGFILPVNKRWEEKR